MQQDETPRAERPDPASAVEPPMAEAAEAAAAVDVGDAETPEAELARLREALAEAERRIAAAEQELLRARAEAENVRRRAARDVEQAHRFGLDRFVGEMLPVVDSLEMGCAAAATAGEVRALEEGMRLTLQMFGAALGRLGVQTLDPQGARFDPERHQAIGLEDGAGVESGSVLRVMQKGYALNERLVRPALVVVAR